MTTTGEQRGVDRMGVVGPTTMYFNENDETELERKAIERFNLTPDNLAAIEAGEEIWIRNNKTGFVDRAVGIKLQDNKPYWLKCQEKGYALDDWKFLEVIPGPKDAPWISSLAFQSIPGFPAPVAISGHALDRMYNDRFIKQEQVVSTCIHGQFIQGNGDYSGDPNDRTVKALMVTDQRNPHGPRRELHVVIKKNYEAKCCEVITAFWADENPE